MVYKQRTDESPFFVCIRGRRVSSVRLAADSSSAEGPFWGTCAAVLLEKCKEIDKAKRVKVCFAGGDR